jgi:hypothetical protein
MPWGDGLASPEVLNISVPLYWFCKDRRKLRIEFVTLKAQIYRLCEHLQSIKNSIFCVIMARTAVEVNGRISVMLVIYMALVSNLSMEAICSL